MKKQIKEIELLLSYVTELQDAGCHETAYNVASIAQNRLGRLIEGMNQSDTKVKELPKYWMVERDECNPLWKGFEKFFEVGAGFGGWGFNEKFYGFTGRGTANGYDHAMNMNGVMNNPTLITLEYWNECVNELP